MQRFVPLYDDPCVILTADSPVESHSGVDVTVGSRSYTLEGNADDLKWDCRSGVCRVVPESVTEMTRKAFIHLFEVIVADHVREPEVTDDEFWPAIYKLAECASIDPGAILALRRQSKQF